MTLGQELTLFCIDASNQEQALSISGRNWGNAMVEEGTLVFQVGQKPAFRIPLKDVGQVQLGREEVISQQAV